MKWLITYAYNTLENSKVTYHYSTADSVMGFLVEMHQQFPEDDYKVVFAHEITDEQAKYVEDHLI